MSTLTEQLQSSLENHWDSVMNGGPSYEDDVVYSSQNLLEIGVGAVVLQDLQGNARWWDCEKSGWRKRI